MRNIPGIISTLLMVFFALWYSKKIYQKQIKPALSTWVIMTIGTVLSFVTFLIVSGNNIFAGVLNMADVFAALIITVSAMVWSHTRLRFKPFEKIYLVIAGVICVFWIFSRNAFISNLLIQSLMFVGYIPTIHKLLKEKSNTESYSAWLIALTAGFFSLYPTIISRNFLSSIYVGRTIIMISLILCLMRYFDKKNNKHIVN